MELNLSDITLDTCLIGSLLVSEELHCKDGNLQVNLLGESKALGCASLPGVSPT